MKYVSSSEGELIILTICPLKDSKGRSPRSSTWSWKTLIEVLCGPPVALIVSTEALDICSVDLYFVAVIPDILAASIEALIFVKASA